MRPISGLEIFRTGDYGEKGKYTESDITEIVKDFREGMVDNKQLPLLVCLNPHNLHDKGSAVTVGKLTNLYMKTGGVLAADGRIQDEFKHVMENFTGKSAGFVNVNGSYKIDHVAIVPRDRAVIKDLKPNNESVFSETREIVSIPFSCELPIVEEKINKEKVMAEIVTFSEAEVKDALDRKEKDLKAEFSIQLEEKKNEIKAKDDLIGELKTQVANFAIAEKNRLVDEITVRLEKCRGIKPDQKKEKLDLLVGFAESGNSELAKKLLEEYEGFPAIVPVTEFSDVERIGTENNGPFDSFIRIGDILKKEKK